MSSRCANIQGRITVKEKDQVIDLVEKGDYMTVSDFVRQAVREKLEREKTR